MKQHASVLMLLARSTIFKLFAILAGMTAVELGLFFWRAGAVPGLEQLFDAAYIRWVFVIVVGALAGVLAGSLGESGSKLDYTLRRLQVSYRSLFVWQCVYNTVCLLILWAVQLFVALLLCRLWVEQREAVSGQAIFLAFYRNEFLHGLLPLADWTRLVSNLFLMSALGVSSAGCAFCRRREKPGFIPWSVAICFFAVFFVGQMGQPSRDLVVCGISVLVVLVSLFMTWGEGNGDEA